MLNAFTPESKAQIVTSILRESANGSDLRACCRAQGITYQTFIDWRCWAQKENRLNGHEATARKVRIPDPPLQNALQAALTKVAEVAQGPDLENPPPFVREAASGPDAAPARYSHEAPDADFMAAVERDIAALEAGPAVEPAANPNEGLDMPRKELEPEQSSMARVLAQRFPWLAEVEARAVEQFGPKPDRLDAKVAYTQWTKNRKGLMTKKQAVEFAAFYGRVPAGTAEPAKPAKPAKPTNGARAPHGPEVEALQAQHAEVQQAMALHPDGLTHAIQIEPITAQPRRVEQHVPWIMQATPDDMAAEITRMQRMITVLTAENMRLRGIL
jgi:transposase-like protein